MKKIFLLSAVFMILFFSAKINAAANWVWVASDSEISIWIDNNSVGRDNNGFFAYFKEAYSDAGKNRIIESRRSAGLSLSGFYNLSHRVDFFYFNSYSGIKYLAFMSYVYYDKNGNVLDSASTNIFIWNRVIPDTYAEVEYDAAYARVWR